jgi:hypothetical protein
VILDTKGNIFGGFTPLKWESGEHHYKADDTQKSFVFTLKNLNNISARKFELKTEKKDQAIICDSSDGPRFGSDCDLAVITQCDMNANSHSCLGISYINDTGLDNKIVFAGDHDFKVKEIEVFEITD